MADRGTRTAGAPTGIDSILAARKKPRPAFLPDYTRGPIRFALATLMALTAVALSHLPVMQALDRRSHDLLVRMAARREPAAEPIVVVAIDEESLDRMEPVVGSWPWPRMLHAPLIEYCSSASVIVMDLLFSERQWQYRETGDPLLIQTVQQLGSRMLFAAHFHDSPADAAVPETLSRMALAPEADVAALPSYSGVILPFEELLTSCRSIGDVNVRRDVDGTVRGYQAMVRMDGKVFPSLALSAVGLYAGIPCEQIEWDADRRLRVGDYGVRLDRDGSFLLLPSAESYPVYRAADVIESFNLEGQDREAPIPRSAFEGKIVLIGATAHGLHDHAVTPMDTATPGVVVHAMAIQNLLTGRRMHAAPAWMGLLLVACMALYPAGRRYARPRRMAVLVLGLLAAYALLVLAAAQAQQLVLPLVGPVSALLLSTMALGGAYWSEERSRRSYIESLDRAKQLFTDMLVHDLKNTLAPITMSLSMRSEGDAEDLADASFWTRDFPEIVSTSSNRLMTQINALLDIRRMQEGKMQLRPQSADLADLLRRISGEYQVAAARTGLSLRVRSELGAGVHAQVDPDVFLRIMSNLIWNAIKYARQGTTVEIETTTGAGGMVEIVVRNEGKPIAPGLQRELFLAFVTGPPPDDMKKIPSTGLGLTFCKLATEAHGGWIRLDSPAPGREGGVQVVISLPVGNTARTGSPPHG